MTQGRGLTGVDTRRPCGVVLTMDGANTSGYAFLPVDDFAQFKAIFQPYIDTMTELDDGLWEIRGKQRRQVIYAKHVPGGWLYVSDVSAHLANTPDNPVSRLGGLPAKYDVAFRVNVSQLPTATREQWISQLRQAPQETSNSVPVRTSTGMPCAGWPASNY